MNCATAIATTFLGYSGLVVVLNLRLARYGKKGTPLGRAAWRSESYSPEGHRLLLWFKRLVLGAPVVLVGLAAAGAVLCSAGTVP